MRSILSLWKTLGILTIAMVLFGAAFKGADAAPAPTQTPTPPASTIAADSTYKLGSGDKLRITVFGEDDLGGQYEVDGGGVVRLPLIGQVQAGGLTVLQFEDQVRSKLADGYLKSPRVSVEVTNYRPFYILGEVGKPGEYPYVNGMTVLNAIALAGGYTNRANVRSVYVQRNGAKEQALPADATTRISPGDIIRVAERFF